MRTPAADLLDEIDSSTICGEAIRGIRTPSALGLLHRAVSVFAAAGADAVFLGCTDLIRFGASAIGGDMLPVVDSTLEHARAAARWAETAS